jgi:hypothetical protein
VPINKVSFSLLDQRSHRFIGTKWSKLEGMKLEGTKLDEAPGL